jgi:hypothetical protein
MFISVLIYKTLDVGAQSLAEKVKLKCEVIKQGSHKLEWLLNSV